MDYVANLLLGVKGETMQYVAFEGPTRRFQPRPCPIHAADTSPVVAAIGVLPPIDDNPRV